jgi:hypothetical protein
MTVMSGRADKKAVADRPALNPISRMVRIDDSLARRFKKNVISSGPVPPSVAAKTSVLCRAMTCVDVTELIVF